jgi:predicted MFS family arabinose efflux permease
MGNMLAFILPLAVLGPAAAHMLSERQGLLRPLFFGLFVVAVDFFLLVNARSPVLFCAYVAVLYIAAMFFWSYAIALVGRVDSSGRFASAVPAFMMIGGAGGPALGGKLIGMFSFQALAVMAALCVIVGMWLFILTPRLAAIKVPVLAQRG